MYAILHIPHFFGHRLSIHDVVILTDKVSLNMSKIGVNVFDQQVVVWA